MKVQIIRASGAEEEVEIAKEVVFAELEKRCNWQCADTVNLRDGRIMLVDDDGLAKEKPKNAKATKLYAGVCRLPEYDVEIVGDVAIVRDEDFA